MSQNQLFERRVRQFFDAGFYLSAYPDVAMSGIAPMEHFLKLGWREGRRPNKWYNDKLVPAALRNKHPGAAPVVVFLTYLPGLNEERFADLCKSQHYMDYGHADCWACDQMRTSFDGVWYRARYPDVAKAGDALVHYCELGWTERRDPAPFFRTEYYLDVNLDVATAQLNPFVHYLSVGQAEGRKPAPEQPVERRQLLELRSFDELARELQDAQLHLEPAAAARLAADLLQQCAGTNGICLALSHDEYLRHTGGVQKFLADEARWTGEEGYLYVHLCPTLPDLRLVETGGMSTLLLNCTIGDRFAGTFTAAEVADTLGWIAGKQPGALKAATVHSVMGWRLDAVTALTQRFSNRFFYVHDYFSLCSEYRLLRNNVRSCQAPPPDSGSCRVCLHGDRRGRHLAQFETFFDAVKPMLVFPSEAARGTFRGAGRFGDLKQVVVPHLAVTRSMQAALEARAVPGVRVAYCGATSVHKGFRHFEQIVRDCLTVPDLRFYHFGAQDSGLDNVEFVKAELRKGRSRLTELLRKHEIDLVFVGSIWAETFNFVAYEAAEAGAAVLAFDDSGNVAAFIDEFEIGAHVPDWRAAVDLLKSRELQTQLTVWRANAASLRFEPNRSFLTKGVFDEKQTLLLHLVQ